MTGSSDYLIAVYLGHDANQVLKINQIKLNKLKPTFFNNFLQIGSAARRVYVKKDEKKKLLKEKFT